LEGLAYNTSQGRGHTGSVFAGQLKDNTQVVVYVVRAFVSGIQLLSDLCEGKSDYSNSLK
jgi:hypothetical protein